MQLAVTGGHIESMTNRGTVPVLDPGHEVLEEAGLKSQLHAYGTNIEGEWDDVMAAVKKCHERVHDMGAPRITTTIKLGTRIDREQGMDDKVKSVLDKM